jgi:methylmalonyl-CoA mutase C-terminal domain/subunit
MNIPPKVMIAKPGLDGHDRGAVVIVQALRDAGIDVIYTGIRRTPEQIAVAAGQEDIDALGISCLSGAHYELCKSLKGHLDKGKWQPDMLFLGGIIPDKDHGPLHKLGFGTIMGPGTRLEEITGIIKKLLPSRILRKGNYSAEWLNTSAALTAIETGQNGKIRSGKRKAKIIMIAGQGGSGKSTLIGGLIKACSSGSFSMAVLVNDPVNPKKNGAILADRLRMPMDFDPEKVFIRSLPVRGSHSISSACRECALYLAQKDYDYVLVETLGIGQNQMPYTNWIDSSVAVISPNQGDQWQLRKNSLLEICDTVVVTKCDLVESKKLFLDLKQVLEDIRPKNMPRIIRTSLQDMSEAQNLLITARQ